MSEIRILEKKEYYKIEINNTSFIKKLLIFDAVKKIMGFDPKFGLFWSTIVGGIKLNPEPSFTNVVSFYVYNYFDKDTKKPFFEKLKSLGLEFSAFFENYKSLEKFLETIDVNQDYILALSFKISNIDSFELKELLDKYTNKYMVIFEALVGYSFINKLQDEIFISDGNLFKFEKFFKFQKFSKESSAKLVGLVKDIERNYLSDFGNQYLLSLPFGYRTSAFLISYNSLKFLSFYLNIGKIIRLEIMGEDMDCLLEVAKIILSLSDLPPLYYRMPQNNVLLTKLERNLKNYLISDILFRNIL